MSSTTPQVPSGAATDARVKDRLPTLQASSTLTTIRKGRFRHPARPRDTCEQRRVTEAELIDFLEEQIEEWFSRKRPLAKGNPNTYVLFL